MSVVITPRETPPPDKGVSITQIAATQNAQGQALVFALCSDGSLWRLGDPAHTGQPDWAEVSAPPVVKP